MSKDRSIHVVKLLMIRKVFITIAITIAIQCFSKSKELGNENSNNFCDKQYSCCTPSLYRHVYNSKKKEFLIKADFLYWQGKLCGLEGAFGNTSVVVDNNTPGIETTTLTEIDRNPNFKWRPGFKIGAEFLVNCFNFDLYWTCFHGRATYSDNAQHGNWKLKYNTIVNVHVGKIFRA